MIAIAAPEEMSEVAILGRVIATESEPLSPEAARFILALTFGPEDRQRMEILAEKARQGTLTEAEAVAIDNYKRAGHVLSLLKSRARQALKEAAQDGGRER
jgi:hypothetical protein